MSNTDISALFEKSKELDQLRKELQDDILEINKLHKKLQSRHAISSHTRSTNRRASRTLAAINDTSSDSTESLERERRILQRRRQIPPRLRSEHQGEGRATANFNSSNSGATLHQQLQASSWHVETPTASSGSSLSKEFISEKLMMDAGCSRLEEETCVICLDAIQVNHEESTTLCCGHVYHVGCIKTWLMVKNECALCRASVILINGR